MGHVEGVGEAAEADHTLAAQLVVDLTHDAEPRGGEGVILGHRGVHLVAQAGDVRRRELALALEEVEVDLAAVELVVTVDERGGPVAEVLVLLRGAAQPLGLEDGVDRRVALRLVEHHLDAGPGHAHRGGTAVVTAPGGGARRGDDQPPELPAVDAVAGVARRRPALRRSHHRPLVRRATGRCPSGSGALGRGRAGIARATVGVRPARGAGDADGERRGHRRGGGRGRREGERQHQLDHGQREKRRIAPEA